MAGNVTLNDISGAYKAIDAVRRPYEFRTDFGDFRWDKSDTKSCISSDVRLLIFFFAIISKSVFLIRSYPRMVDGDRTGSFAEI